jgi:hypothetical protein
MVKHARARFQSAGWTLTHAGTETADFEVKRRELKFPIKCVDSSAWTYKNPNRLIEQIQISSAHMLQSFRITLVWIVQPEPSAPSPARMLDLGCLAFAPDEIDIVINLSRFDDTPPRDLDPREKVLLCSSVWECIRFSNAFKTLGDQTEALAWMRYAVTASRGFSAAYWALMKLLTTAGDLASAEALADHALALRPEASEFAEAVRELAESQGDAERAKTWKERHAQASIKLPRQPSFDDIISKQGLSLPDKDRSAQPKEGRSQSRRRWFQVF